MNCGKTRVWEEEDSERDYAGGTRHLCHGCGFEFYGFPDTSFPESHKDITEKLKKR